MSFRQPAAEKLVRQLLELRLYRLTPLSDEFVTAMAKIAIAHVDLDEQHQRSEEIIAKLDASQGVQAPATGLSDR